MAKAPKKASKPLSTKQMKKTKGGMAREMMGTDATMAGSVAQKRLVVR
jgi:hypothetical protein